MSSTEDERLVSIRNHIANYQDFPKPGVLFRDIFPLFCHPQLVQDVIELMTSYITKNCEKIDIVVGIESRGFLFAVPLSLRLNVPFVPIRKKGKLPGETEHVTFSLEYGVDSLEMQKHVIKQGQNVVIIDDLLATGGTLAGACELTEKLGGKIAVAITVIELLSLEGRNNVKFPLHSLLQYA